MINTLEMVFFALAYAAGYAAGGIPVFAFAEVALDNAVTPTFLQQLTH